MNDREFQRVAAQLRAAMGPGLRDARRVVAARSLSRMARASVVVGARRQQTPTETADRIVAALDRALGGRSRVPGQRLSNIGTQLRPVRRSR